MKNSKAKGILRATPRYSAEKNPSSSLRADGPSSVVRSLADLVRSSAELSAEAADIGITHAEVGRVVSHHSLVPAANVAPDIGSVSIEDSNNGNDTFFDSDIKREQEAKIMEGMGLSTLQISESGAPYLRATRSVVSSSRGPPLVACGIVGEDGQHVTFCEYDDDNGKENEQNTSSRERIQHRIDVNDAGDDEDTFDDDEETSNGFHESDSENSDSDATSDDAILAELGMHDLIPSEHDSDYEPEEQPMASRSNHSEGMRAFIIIWQTLSQWLTATTIELLQGNETAILEPSTATPCELSNNETAQRTSVEIGVSRRSGIMSMLQMYIKRSLVELKRIPLQTQHQKDILNDQRKIEQRLADLVQTFDTNGSVANFNSKQWKAMTTILIVISYPSLGTDFAILPASVQSLGMTTEEYRYLTQSALTSLSHAT